ncbi:hypothetical protein MMC07_001047 [Pseudocyphellaria aurata]|nr:hypothetical protein [Pseudocyphellaria aurata]
MPFLYGTHTPPQDVPLAIEDESEDEEAETERLDSSDESSGSSTPTGPPLPEAPQANEVQSSDEASGSPAESEDEYAFEVEGLETILGVPDHFNPPPTGSTIRLSPLGQQLSDESAELLGRDALTWHLVYWLCLSVFAIMSGEDPVLVSVLVEIEQKSLQDPELTARILREFNNFLLIHRDEYMAYWAQRLDSDEGRAFLLEVNDLVVDKARRVREYLAYGETAMFQELRHGSPETARRFFEIITRCYRVLLEEEARNQTPA